MRGLGTHMARRLVLRDRGRVGRVSAGMGYVPSRSYAWSDWMPCAVRELNPSTSQDGADAPVGIVTVLLEPGTMVDPGDHIEIRRGDSTDTFEAEGPVERGPVLYVQARRVP